MEFLGGAIIIILVGLAIHFAAQHETGKKTQSGSSALWTTDAQRLVGLSVADSAPATTPTAHHEDDDHHGGGDGSSVTFTGGT
jgi:hypothetical protein